MNDRLKNKKEKKVEELKDWVLKFKEVKDVFDIYSINRKKLSVVNEKNNKEWIKVLDDLEYDIEF